jgi:hypothetical protein
MANKFNPIGGKPIGNMLTTTYSGKSNKYYIPASDNDDLWVNDFVKLIGNSDEYGIPIIAKADPGDKLVGVVDGIKNIQETNSYIYRQAGEERFIYVIDDPWVELEMQVNGEILNTDIGQNADIIVGAGDPATGTSTTQIDLDTLSSASAQIKIIGVVDKYGNEWGDFTHVRCFIAEHEYKDIQFVGENLWDRTGTTLIPHNSGDDLDMGTGDIGGADLSLTGDVVAVNGSFSGKLTVAGLIDPTALVLDAQGSAPISTDGTIYYDNNSTRFRFRENGVWVTLAETNLWGRSGTDLSPVNAGDDLVMGTGDVNATNITLTGDIDAVDVTLSGDLVAVDGTFSGNIGAVGGTFTGNIGAVDATLSGDLVAVGGTFSGNIGAVGGTFSGNIGAVDATLSGDLVAVGGTFSGNIGAVDTTLSGDLVAVNGSFSGKLTVDGLIDPTALVLDAQGSAPISTDGTIYYDSGTTTFQFRENGAWITLGDSGIWDRTGTDISPTTAGDNLVLGTGDLEATSVITTPQGSAPGTDDGTIYYNSSSATFQFRENGTWSTLGAASTTPFQRIGTIISPINAGDDLDMGTGDVNATSVITTPQGSAPGTNNGTIYYNSSTHTFNFRENGAWSTLAAGSTSPFQRTGTTISPVNAGDDLDMGTGDVNGVDATLTGDLTAVGATLSGNLGAVDATLSGDLVAVGGTFSGNVGAVDATLSGDLVAVGGTFSGNIGAVGGTFSSDVAAVGGTFSGNIGAVDATLSGDLVAIGGTFSGNIGALGGTFSGDVTAVDATLSGDLVAVDGTFSGDIEARDAHLTGKLTVDGLIDPTALLLDPQGSAPTTTAGTIYYDSPSSTFRFREGSNWLTLGNSDIWDRSGTTISPENAGDDLDMGTNGNIQAKLGVFTGHLQGLSFSTIGNATIEGHINDPKSVALKPQSVVPPATNGTIYYDTTGNRFQFREAGNWFEIGHSSIWKKTLTDIEPRSGVDTLKMGIGGINTPTITIGTSATIATATVSGKLTVNGIIENPKGIDLNPQSSAPVSNNGTIFYNSSSGRFEFRESGTWVTLGSSDLWKRTGTTLEPVISGDGLNMGAGSINATSLTLSGDIVANEGNFLGTLYVTNEMILNPSGITFTTKGSAPAADNATIYYNSSSHKFQFRENGAWVTLGDTSVWERTGTTISPETAGDDLDMGTGDIEAVNLTLNGNLGAVDATLSGDLVAVGGTFSGNIGAVDGSFSGDISAVNANFTGKLTVSGEIDPTALLLDPQGSAPTTTAGTIYYDSGSNRFLFRESTSWITLGNSDIWNRTGTNISPAVAGDDLIMGTGDINAAAATFTGNVGAATVGLTGNLTVAGAINNPTNVAFTGQGSAPTTANGAFYYNSSSNKFEFRENGAWVTLGDTSVWDRTGTTISPETAGDDLDMGTGKGSFTGIINKGLQKVIRTATATNYNPSALTDDYLIAVTNTAVARNVIISTEDVQSGSTSHARVFVIKDESGGAGTNNITVSLESGTIDGQPNFVININHNAVALYVDGTNGHIIYEYEDNITGNAWAPDYFSGFAIEREGGDPDHDTTFLKGSARGKNDLANMKITAGLTKQIDANWAEGNNQGGFPSGLTLLANTWYHCLL